MVVSEQVRRKARRDHLLLAIDPNVREQRAIREIHEWRQKYCREALAREPIGSASHAIFSAALRRLDRLIEHLLRADALFTRFVKEPNWSVVPQFQFPQGSAEPLLCGKLWGMGDELSAEQAKKLADELSALSKLQSEALEAAIYVSMSQEEAKEYDERGARIGELCRLLGKFKPNDDSD